MSATVLSRSETTGDTDAQIAHRIRRHLAASSRAQSRLQVEVEEGVVTLRGTATSFYQKQLWIHGTKQVVGNEAEIKDEVIVTPYWEENDLGWRD
jgi:osmotically-inducible protein OsmY